MKKKIVTLALASLVSTATVAELDTTSEHAEKTLEIYTHIVEIESSKNLGNVPKIAKYLASELVAAGFPPYDVEVLPLDDTAALVARFRGDNSSGKAPILFLGHMDVVEALADDWERPPFELTTDGNYFFARGSEDNKFGVAQLTSTFIRLKKEGFVPNRDLIIAFSGDEESTMLTTKMMAYEREDLRSAEFALNSDSGGGSLKTDGTPVIYQIQSAEKTYVTFDMTVRNPGGHSSRPRPDNAIYDLSDAITKIQHYQFPVRSSEMTQEYFEITGEQLGGALGDAMIAFANNPNDTTASDRLAIESSYVGTTRTTCVATQLQAGHAENALPQSATATINCRVFPGVPVEAIEKALNHVVENDEIEFAQREEATESPVSQMTAEIRAAIGKAVHARYPDLTLLPYMASGGTDGMHFRNAGIPTWGVSALFMNPDENFAHGLNERVPVAGFYGGLDHWSVIIRELAGN